VQSVSEQESTLRRQGPGGRRRSTNVPSADVVFDESSIRPSDSPGSHAEDTAYPARGFPRVSTIRPEIDPVGVGAGGAVRRIPLTLTPGLMVISGVTVEHGFRGLVEEQLPQGATARSTHCPAGRSWTTKRPSEAVRPLEETATRASVPCPFGMQ
jgi:hypothetical protein